MGLAPGPVHDVARRRGPLAIADARAHLAFEHDDDLVLADVGVGPQQLAGRDRLAHQDVGAADHAGPDLEEASRRLRCRIGRWWYDVDGDGRTSLASDLR